MTTTAGWACWTPLSGVLQTATPSCRSVDKHPTRPLSSCARCLLSGHARGWCFLDDDDDDDDDDGDDEYIGRRRLPIRQRHSGDCGIGVFTDRHFKGLWLE